MSCLSDAHPFVEARSGDFSHQLAQERRLIPMLWKAKGEARGCSR